VVGHSRMTDRGQLLQWSSELHGASGEQLQLLAIRGSSAHGMITALVTTAQFTLMRASVCDVVEV